MYLSATRRAGWVAKNFAAKAKCFVGILRIHQPWPSNSLSITQKTFAMCRQKSSFCCVVRKFCYNLIRSSFNSVNTLCVRYNVGLFNYVTREKIIQRMRKWWWCINSIFWLCRIIRCKRLFAQPIQTRCFLILKRTLLHVLNTNYRYQDPIIVM